MYTYMLQTCNGEFGHFGMNIASLGSHKSNNNIGKQVFDLSTSITNEEMTRE